MLRAASIPTRNHSLQRRSPLDNIEGHTPGLLESGRRDLNPRPLRPERSALPNCATSRTPDTNGPAKPCLLREQPAPASVGSPPAGS